MHRARVFISCGQNASLGEVTAARAVAEELSTQGFDPYIALEQQTLSGVKESIFRVLEEAEYYLFIDFKRERLVGVGDPAHRGSLFTHQELAIAAFLDKDVIALREDGVRNLDGIMSFLQANAIQFTSREELPTLVSALVSARGWVPHCYNGLTIAVNDPAYDDAEIGATGYTGRFFHLRVANRHPTRSAESCMAYLDSIRHEDGGATPYYETVEFKWAGYTHPSARIAAQGYRLLDAFWVLHTRPEQPQFNTFADSTRFVPRFAGTGWWILRFSVTSTTVRGVTREFRIRLSPDLESAAIEPVG
jgi:hypothetical protein